MIGTVIEAGIPWDAVAAACGFAVLFPGLSFLVNRRLCHGELDRNPTGILLLAGLVFCTAILCEALVNPIYEHLFNEKLWVYRLLPLRDGNISVLSVVVWTSYGVHLYFLNQTLDRVFAPGARRMLYKSLLIGVEAPLVWEVAGNAFFLLTVGEFYAYYIPGELFHLTSVRVVPIYAVCVFFGLLLYDGILRLNPRWPTVLALFAVGLGFLGVS